MVSKKQVIDEIQGAAALIADGSRPPSFAQNAKLDAALRSGHRAEHSIIRHRANREWMVDLVAGVVKLSEGLHDRGRTSIVFQVIGQN